jgi:hypothetical protein
MPNTIIGTDHANVIDFLEVSGAIISNPPDGMVRLFANSATGLLDATASDGSSAIPAAGTAPHGLPNLVLATDPSGSSSDTAALRPLVPADLPEAYAVFTTTPAHYNSTGVAGELAVAAPAGSPPVGYFYICLASDFWLRVGTDGSFSASF